MNSVKRLCPGDLALLTMSSLLVTRWIELPPGVREVMGAIPVRDSDFFFVPCSCLVHQFPFHIFITELKIHHLYSFVDVLLNDRLSTSSWNGKLYNR